MPAPIAGVDGAWACPGCGNVNFATREVCNRCQGPKVEGFVSYGQQQFSAPKGKPVAGVDGAWGCGVCQNVNFATRDACNRCQTPKEQAETQMPAGFGAGGGGGGRGGAPVAGVDGNWACPGCGNVNFATRIACNRCQQPKPADDGFGGMVAAAGAAWAGGGGGGGGRGGAPVAGVDGNWACPGCGNVNFATREACNRCQAPKAGGMGFGGGGGGKGGGAPMAGTDGNWKCGQCQNVNFAQREACNRCGAARSEAEVAGFGGGKSGGKGRAPVAGVDGNWACPGCGNVNYAQREACNRCQTPKPMEEAAAAGVEDVGSWSSFDQLLSGDQPAKRMRF